MGNALCTVGGGGRLVLPAFVRSTLARRGDPRILFVGNHAGDPCLVAYDRSHAAALASDCRRLRSADEADQPYAYIARSRRIFGFVEEVCLDGRARVALPAMMLRRAGIGDLALVIGAGGLFEIWSPEVALKSADADLRELAAFRLDIQQAA